MRRLDATLSSPSLPSTLTAPTDTLARIGDLVVDGLHALDAWLAARRRAAQDRFDLAAMSERELADIGVSRASIDAVASGSGLRDVDRPRF